MVSRRRFAAAIAGAALLARIPTVFAAKPYDLLIRKGRIIDPSVGLDLVGDLAVSGGRIAAIGPAIEGDAGETIDARGKIVAPGLIDIHTHAGRSKEGPPLCLQDGVTGWVDAGSGGADNIDAVAAVARQAPQIAPRRALRACFRHSRTAERSTSAPSRTWRSSSCARGRSSSSITTKGRERASSACSRLRPCLMASASRRAPSSKRYRVVRPDAQVAAELQKGIPVNSCLRLVSMALTCFASLAFAQQTATPLKVSGENKNFEWFFLLTDAGKVQGIWSKNGLNPEFVPAAGSAAQLKEQVSTGVKIGWVNTAEVLIARSQGVPVKVVAAHFGETIAKIFAAPDAAISQGRDLDRKKIGILSPSHTSYKTVLYINEKLGIRAEPVALGNLANNVAALKARKIDAFYSAEGAALGLVASGELKIAVRLAELYPKPYTAVVVWATDDLIRDHPATVRAFVNGTLESVRYLQGNPESASQIYVKRTGASKPLADRAVAELNSLLTTSGRGSGNDLVAAVEGNWKFTRDSGSVPASVSMKIEDAVDTRFLP